MCVTNRSVGVGRIIAALQPFSSFSFNFGEEGIRTVKSNEYIYTTLATPGAFFIQDFLFRANIYSIYKLEFQELLKF